jgi:hypothetical protein
MIVGTIQWEDVCSWQDASKSWLEQDEEEEDGTYHVGTCQGTSSLPLGTREKQCSAVVCPPKEEDEDAETVEDSWWTPEPEDLQIKGEEKEYFFELLMRESAMREGVTEKPTTVGSKAGQPAKKWATRRNKAASSGGKRKGSGKTSKGESEVTAKLKKKEADTLWGASQAARRGWRHLIPPATRGLRTGDYKLAPSRRRDQECK